jgi:hypothetical protein
MLKSRWPQRKVFLEGSLWPGQSGAAHSVRFTLPFKKVPVANVAGSTSVLIWIHGESASRACCRVRNRMKSRRPSLRLWAELISRTRRICSGT